MRWSNKKYFKPDERASDEEYEAWRKQELVQLKWEHEMLRLKFDLFCIELVWKDMLYKAGYNPNQRRVPAGSTDGGQWISGGGSGGAAVSDYGRTPDGFVDPAYHPVNDPAIIPSYPIENAIIAIYGGRMVSTVAAELGVSEAVIQGLLGLGRSGSGIDAAMQAERLIAELEEIDKTAEKIANGHAYDRHVISQKEFPEIKNPEQLKEKVSKIIKEAKEVRNLERNRIAYWDEESKSIVILDPAHPDGGTIFKPSAGKRFFDINVK